jgi:hypothetical protein
MKLFTPVISCSAGAAASAAADHNTLDNDVQLAESPSRVPVISQIAFAGRIMPQQPPHVN